MKIKAMETEDNKIDIKEHRKAIRNAFEKDPDFKRAYIDNTAMFLHDRIPNNFKWRKDISKRNKIAEELLNLIFDGKITLDLGGC